MVAVSSAVLTSMVNPPCTGLSKVTVTVMPIASSSFPLTSAMVKVALSSLVMVTVPVSVTSMSAASKSVTVRLLMEMVNVSSASNLLSSVGSTVKVCSSPIVPAKVRVCPVIAV